MGSDFECNKNSLAETRTQEGKDEQEYQEAVTTKDAITTGKNGGHFKRGSRCGDCKMWSDSGQRADKIY